MDPQRWPMQPLHLTSDGETYSGKDLSRLSGLGILPNDHLQGIQTTICVNLGKNPTTIIEFSPYGEPVRTDSVILQEFMRAPCRVFRECTDNRLCHQSDNEHASILYGMSRQNLIEQARQRVQQSAFLRQYHVDRGIPFAVKRTRRGRPFLEYDCPFLGYREMIFPVFFEERVLAAFFVGQNAEAGRADEIRARARAFLTELSPPLLEPGMPDAQRRGADFECAPATVLGELDEWLDKPGHLLSSDDLESLIEEADRQLDRLERILAEQMEQQRQQYIRDNVDPLMVRMHVALHAEKEKRDGSPAADLWLEMRGLLDDLVARLGLKYALVFSSERLSDQNSKTSYLRVVAQGGQLPPPLAAQVAALKISTERMSLRLRSLQTEAVDHPDPLFANIEGVPSDFSLERTRIMIFGATARLAPSTVVLLGFSAENPPTAPVNRINGYLDRSLKSLFVVYEWALSTLAAISAQATQKDSLRIFGHELGHQTQIIEKLAFQYLNQPAKLRAVTDEKAHDLCGDVDAFLKLLSLVSRTAELAVGEIPKPKRTSFWPYSQLLFKWKDTYRVEAKERDLQFDMVYPRGIDPERPQIYADQGLLELLIYNLVSNAFKYCHRGTKVRLDCRRSDASTNNNYIFTVEDYGSKIKSGDEMYGLFTRGENADPKGLGIGLHVAKRMAEAHGGTISHECERVSEHNVPIMEAYIRSRNADPQLAALLSEELIVLRDTGAYERIVARDEFGKPRYARPAWWDVRERICEGTYRVTFTVRIPTSAFPLWRVADEHISP